MDAPTVYLHADCAPFLREGDEGAISLAEAKRVGLYPADYRFAPCPVDVEVREGQLISVGDLQLQVIETPGHSLGHTSFLMEQAGQRVLFGGDLIFFSGRLLDPVYHESREWATDRKSFTLCREINLRTVSAGQPSRLPKMAAIQQFPLPSITRKSLKLRRGLFYG